MMSPWCKFWKEDLYESIETIEMLVAYGMISAPTIKFTIKL